jgi:uncharacterized membrane protein
MRAICVILMCAKLLLAQSARLFLLEKLGVVAFVLAHLTIAQRQDAVN